MKNRSVLVIKRDERFSSILRESGLRVLNLEVIETVPVEDFSELNERLDRIGEYDGLFITSPAAAEVLRDQFAAVNRDFGGKVYGLGSRVRKVLGGSGLNLIVPEGASTAAHLIGSFAETEFAGKRFLFIRGNRSMRTIPDLLAPIAQVDEVAVYKTRELRPQPNVLARIRRDLSNGQISWLCFFSPSGVESFVKLIGVDPIKQTPVAVIGETTAISARQAGLAVSFVSPRTSAEGFAKSFLEYLKNFD